MHLEKEERKHSTLKHLLHMALCCGLPIVIILTLPFVAKVSPVLSTVLGFIAPFICPIMMGGRLLMMFGIKKNNCCNDTKQDLHN